MCFLFLFKQGRSSNPPKRLKKNGQLAHNTDQANGQTHDILLTDVSCPENHSTQKELATSLKEDSKPNNKLNKSFSKISNDENNNVNANIQRRELKLNHSVNTGRDSPSAMSKNSMNLLLQGNENDNDSASSNEDQTNSNEFKETNLDIFTEEEDNSAEMKHTVIIQKASSHTDSTPKTKSSSLSTKFNKLIRMNSPFRQKSGGKGSSKKKISFNFKKILNSDETSQNDSNIVINSDQMATNEAQNDAETAFYTVDPLETGKPNVSGNFSDDDDISLNDQNDTRFHKIDKLNSQELSKAKVGNGSLKQKLKTNSVLDSNKNGIH